MVRRARLMARDTERIGERRAEGNMPRSVRVLNHERERPCLLISGRQRRDALWRCW